MFIESLAQKTRLAMMTVMTTIAGCAVICGFAVWCCISLVNKERQQVHVPDSDIPFLVEHTQLEANFTMEAKAHIQLFHQCFFSLPPGNNYTKWTLDKATYVADGTALKQRQALDEDGFYPDIISSLTIYAIMCDSILLDEHERKFIYYGMQFIKRRTEDSKRSMIATGYIGNVPRTRNNPRELMIMNWRTIGNKDLDY